MATGRVLLSFTGGLLLCLALIQVGPVGRTDACVGHHCGSQSMATFDRSESSNLLCLHDASCAGGTGPASAAAGTLGTAPAGLATLIALVAVGVAFLRSTELISGLVPSRLFRPPRQIG